MVLKEANEQTRHLMPLLMDICGIKRATNALPAFEILVYTFMKIPCHRVKGTLQEAAHSTITIVDR